MATYGEQLLSEYTGRVQNAQKFKEMLEKAYNEKTEYNKDLIEQKNQLQNQLYSEPARLREEYYSSPIRNALTQENLIGQRLGETSSRLGTITDLLNARGQQYQNILGQGQARYQADLEALKLSADQQLQKEAEERARALAAASRGYGGGGSAGDTEADFWNTVSATAEERTANWPRWEGSAGSPGIIDAKHRELMSYARSMGINVSEQELWNYLGNPNSVPKPSVSPNYDWLRGAEEGFKSLNPFYAAQQAGTQVGKFIRSLR